jgi:hypothetical protein
MVTTEFILYVVSVAFFIFIIMYYYNDKKTPQPVRTEIIQASHQSQQEHPHMSNGLMPPPPGDPLRKFDYDAVDNDFTPPYRRSLYDESSYNLVPGLFPTYTRGPPGRFRKIGTLIAQGVGTNDTYKFLYLYGREKYPGRELQYYAAHPHRDNRIKFDLPTRGKEIFDGDIIVIDGLEGYTFTFKEDIDLSPQYDPYFAS